MTNEFNDITDRLGKPKWYDLNGYPRYCKFHPHHVSNIYADYVALIEIGCQGCHRRWIVASPVKSWGNTIEIISSDKKTVMIKSMEFPCRTDVGSFHYGDPPSHVKADHAGSTMNSVSIRIIEFWKLDNSKFPRWNRVKKYEGLIKQDWAHDILHIQRRQTYLRKFKGEKLLRGEAKRQMHPGKKQQHAS